METAFTPFTLDESSARHIQSVNCKFTLSLALIQDPGIILCNGKILDLYIYNSQNSPNCADLSMINA
jgi:hypothetical protein